MTQLPTIDLDLSLTVDDFDGIHRYTFHPFELRWDGNGPVPLITVNGVGGVPHLREIHPRHWAAVLAPIDRHRRSLAYSGGGLTPPEITAVFDLLDRLPAPAVEAVPRTGSGLPATPVAAAVAPPSARQLNMRLTAGEYDELCVVAGIVGIKPTQLGRMLVLTGVRNMLAEHGGSFVAGRR